MSVTQHRNGYSSELKHDPERERDRSTFTASDQRRVDREIAVTLDDETTPTGLWRELGEHDRFDTAIRTAALDLTDDVSDLGEYRTHLYDQGVTALDGLYTSACAGVVALDQGAHDRLRELTLSIGSGQTPLDLRSEWADIFDGPIALLRLADDDVVSPEIEIRIDQGFCEDVRREQRERVCRLLSELAIAGDVAVSASGLTQRWLREKHREDLPTFEFSSSSNTRRDPSPVAELVEQARDELDYDSTEVMALREIAAEPAETLSRRALANVLPVSSGRVSQVIGTLDDLELIERFGPRRERELELTNAGSAYLDALDADIGRQAKLDAEFSETPKRNEDVRESPGSGFRQDGLAAPGTISQVRALGRGDAIAAHPRRSSGAWASSISPSSASRTSVRRCGATTPTPTAWS